MTTPGRWRSEKPSLGREFIQYLKEIDAVLVNDLGLSIDGNYHTPALSSQEIIVKIKEGEGWMLKISSLISRKTQKKFSKRFSRRSSPGRKEKNLDYLDLRVKGKVYYKMK